MRYNGIVIAVYALLVLVGGMIGFAKADSVPSLVMGVTFSLALLLAGVGMVKERKIGFYAAMTLTFILAAFFAYRFTLSHQFMPAGFMSALSLVVMIALFLGGSSPDKK